MRPRLGLLAILAFLAACSSGGSSTQASFLISGTTPAAGATEVSPDTLVQVIFSLPADFSSVDSGALRLETGQGDPVPGQIVTHGYNPSIVQFQPSSPLSENTLYRIVVKGTIKATDGTPLGADETFTFITTAQGPTIRPDQLVDLGEALNVPRYLAQAVRVRDGRTLVFGGYTDAASVTDTIEVYDPTTRTFALLATHMRSPRAEFAAQTLADGRVLLVGGVAQAGGPPLASTEIFDPSTDVSAAGPSMNQGRRAPAASEYLGVDILVTGGFDANGDRLDSMEVFRGDHFENLAKRLPTGYAQHVQYTFNFGKVVLEGGNANATTTTFDLVTGEITPRNEPFARFRAAFLRIPDEDALLIVGGDDRSILTYDLDTNFARVASSLLVERRGAHTLTLLDRDNRLYLVAGGFNIARQGDPPLDSMEIIQQLPIGPFDYPDAAVYFVRGVTLPVPFAGHVGFLDPQGNTVLAGGIGDGIGPNSRHAVLILAN